MVESLSIPLFWVVTLQQKLTIWSYSRGCLWSCFELLGILLIFLLVLIFVHLWDVFSGIMVLDSLFMDFFISSLFHLLRVHSMNHYLRHHQLAGEMDFSWVPRRLFFSNLPFSTLFFETELFWIYCFVRVIHERGKWCLHKVSFLVFSNQLQDNFDRIQLHKRKIQGCTHSRCEDLSRLLFLPFLLYLSEWRSSNFSIYRLHEFFTW